jgi:GTP pyrophosphokinase
MVKTRERTGGEVRLIGEQAEAWIASLGAWSPEESDIILRACRFTAKALESGGKEPTLPPGSQEVASILGELRLDHECIAASILHSAVPQGAVQMEEVRSQFSTSVWKLVQGLNQMDIIQEFKGQSEKSEKGKKDRGQAESIRKMLLAMVEDLRVVLIKLADRLYAMRTAASLPEGKRRQVAQESLEIFAPLANRLGIGRLRWELEDLSFRHLDPDTYKRVARHLDERRVDREKNLVRIVETLRKELGKAGIESEVSGRPKHIYSIWRKMQRKNVDFHQVFDVRAIRILVKDVADCYATLGIVHSLWPYIHGEFDDYIATPKENMYQALHTVVVGPDGKNLEIQIRTRQMHQHAELGVAAHWHYKEGIRTDPEFQRKIAWVRQMLEGKEEEGDPGGFVDRFKSEVFRDRVYLLTPKGTIVDLPVGATPLDFAYYLHTQIGHRCRGAKVNGRIVPLTYELKNGEQVEILTSRQPAPSREWLNPHLGYLKTPRARSKVRQWFRQQDFEKNAAAGRTALDRELQRLGLSDLNLEKLSQRFGFDRLDAFLEAIGRGDVTATQIVAVVGELTAPSGAPDKEVLEPQAPKKSTDSGEVSVLGVGNLLTTLARCCQPVPDDPIIGYVTRGRGVTIHRRDCPNVLRLESEKHERLIRVDWSGKSTDTYPVNVRVVAYDRQGLLKDIASLLTEEKVNVLSVHTDMDKREKIASMSFTLEITGISQLSRVLSRIGQLPNIMEARRQT